MSTLPEAVLLKFLKKYEAEAERAKAEGNNDAVALNLRKAAEVLMQLSEQKTGQAKEAYVARAEGMIAIAESLSDKDVFSGSVKKSKPNTGSAPKASSDAAKPNSASAKEEKDNGEGKKSGEKKEKSADSTETNWEAVKIPDISFADVAGLNAVKDAVMTQFIYPRKHKEVYKTLGATAGGGILMYGPPGTGKTLMAKAIAHEVGAKFFQVKCSDVVSKWFGEAEKNIKNLFNAARAEGEAVIFFDEFESIAAKRGGESNSVMSRLVPELLAQIQGFNDSDSTLLLIAATNRPWDIDSAFLRPGRFNDLLYVPLPDAPARMYIIKKLLKNTPMEEDIDIKAFVEYTDGFNGADVENFCNKIKQNAAKRVINNGLDDIIVTQADVDLARKEIKSSVSQEDITMIKKFEKDMKRA